MYDLTEFCQHYGYTRGSDAAADAYAAYRRGQGAPIQPTPPGAVVVGSQAHHNAVRVVVEYGQVWIDTERGGAVTDVAGLSAEQAQELAAALIAAADELETLTHA